MANNSISLRVRLIKDKAIKLYGNHQIPSMLAYEINNINAFTPKEYIAKLMYLSEHFLRIKGYYKKYEKEEIVSNEYISNYLQKGEEN